MKNTGVIRKIDNLGRIVVPKEIRRNLNIHNGDDVQIFIEEDKIVLKKYQKMFSIKESVQMYLDVVSKFVKGDIADRAFVFDLFEKVIASSNKKYLNDVIDSKVISLINDRRQDIGHTLTIGNNKLDLFYSVSPIIVDADAIGSMILMNSSDIQELYKVVISILNSILNSMLY